MRYMISGVYAITLVSDGRSYIGSSVHIHKRWAQHQQSLRRGDHHSQYLQRVWKVNGEDAFEFSILETCANEYLIEREQAWMDLCSPVFNTLPTAGNSLGSSHTEETKEKIRQIRTGTKASDDTKARMSEAHKKQWAVNPRDPEITARIGDKLRGRPLPLDHPARGPRSPEWCANISAGKMGHEVSDETRAKMSESRKGKSPSLETQAKVRESNKKNNAELKELGIPHPAGVGAHNRWHRNRNIIKSDCIYCQDEIGGTEAS